MTFLHKLARRLARLKAGTLAAVAVVSAAAAIVGCEQPVSQFVTPTVSRLVVSPQVVTLQPDQAQDFMAVGFTPTGDTAQVDVTWSTSRGSLSDKGTKGGRHYGQYRNAGCGTSTVTATAHPGNVTGEASVQLSTHEIGALRGERVHRCRCLAAVDRAAHHGERLRAPRALAFGHQRCRGESRNRRLADGQNVRPLAGPGADQ